MSKTETVRLPGWQVPKEVADRLKALADAEGRSQANMIIRLIMTAPMPAK